MPQVRTKSARNGRGSSDTFSGGRHWGDSLTMFGSPVQRHHPFIASEQ
jgi:hypothetical protein